MLSKNEKGILLYISDHGLNLSREPFLEVADELGMAEEDVIAMLQGLRRKGVIKDLRGVIDPKKAGYKENALIAWRVPDEKADAVKNNFVENDLVSHCYEREPGEGFNYNIFTMVHAKKIKEIEDFVERAAEEFNCDYALLFTERELKKEKLDMGEFL
ncbi:MAG: hypothetical protein V3S04_04465 [Candidatus Omnitrophota bacterium]